MIIPGPQETLQLVDRSGDLPVMQHLATLDEVIAFAAPALAAVADAYAVAPETERFGLMNRLEEILRDCSDSLTPGLGSAAPRFRVLPLSLNAVMSFSKIRQVLGEEDLFTSQTYAVAHGEDIPLLLMDSEQAKTDIKRLHDAGIEISVNWIV